MILLTFADQFFPLLVYVVLSFPDHPLISPLEHVAESPLLSQELLHRKFPARFIGESPDAVLDLIERPDTGLYSQPADLRKFRSFIPPAPGTGSQHVQETRALCVDCLIGLSVQIPEVAQKSSLCNIRNILMERR